MPELPEVETIRRSLQARLPGARMHAVQILRPDVCATPAGLAPRAPDLLAGLTIDRIERHGKQLAIISRQGPALAVHLGMTGQLLLSAEPNRPPRQDHVHVVWQLDTDAGPRTLAFRDPRRFGGIWAFRSFDELARARWSPLGPDALKIEPGHLHAALALTRRSVKAALLDQRLLAGVRNIYADEALFRAGIRPSRPGRSLTPSESARLAAAVRHVLGLAIRRRGSSLRDYVDPEARPGDNQRRLLVYGRAGQPCRRCRALLRSRTLAQRTTVWCPTCQR